MANLAAKYRPSTLEDVTEQNLVVEMVRNLCSKSDLEARNFLFTGPAGTGKANPLYTNILTPGGWVKMRDVHVGTKVFTRNGDIATIAGVYPQGVKPVYRITLSDRTHIDVSDEHLNVVYWYNEDKKRREDFVLTTMDLIDKFEHSRFKLRIDVPQVDWDFQEVPVDPYLLGALVGDGSLSDNFQFSNPEEDVVEKVDHILRRDWNSYLRKCPGDNVDWDICCMGDSVHKYLFSYDGRSGLSFSELRSILEEQGYPKFDYDTVLRLVDGRARNVQKHFPELMGRISKTYNSNYYRDNYTLRDALRDLGLLDVKSIEKRIPKQYLFNSRSVRIEVLRGIYDTDGYTGSRGDTSISTSSPWLSEDLEFLCRSLGIRDTVSPQQSSYTHNGKRVKASISYSHYLKIPNDLDYCTSGKHLSRRTIKQTEPIRNIVSIEYLGQEECQCVYVDDPDHTYICEDGFIPTHNTTLCRIIANMLNRGEGSPIEIDAASHSGVEAMRDIVSQAQSYPVGCDWKCFIVDEVHSISNQGWQTLLKTLEESPAKSIFLMATTNPEKIPATILSRVQTFQLSKISLSGIESRLKYIISKENEEGQGITYEDSAISFIAKMANGGMRDSITLLEKAIAYDKNITSKGLVKALGLPNYDDFFALLQAYAKKDNAAISQIVDQVYNSGINFLKWMTDFHSFVVNVMKYIFLQDINRTTIPAYYQDKISRYGLAHSSICLQLANTLVKLNHELKSTQYLQELTLTYLCFQPKR